MTLGGSGIYSTKIVVVVIRNDVPGRALASDHLIPRALAAGVRCSIEKYRSSIGSASLVHFAAGECQTTRASLC